MAYMIDTYEEMLEQGCEDKEDTLKKAEEVKTIFYMQQICSSRRLSKTSPLTDGKSLLRKVHYMIIE